MASESATLDIVRQIVQERFPDQSEVLDFEGPELIQRLGEPSRSMKETPDLVSGFGDPVQLILEWVPLTIGTYHFLRAQRNRRKHFDSLGDDWRTELTNAGLDDDEADRIAKSFLEDVFKRLT